MSLMYAQHKFACHFVSRARLSGALQYFRPTQSCITEKKYVSQGHSSFRSLLMPARGESLIIPAIWRRKELAMSSTALSLKAEAALQEILLLHFLTKLKNYLSQGFSNHSPNRSQDLPAVSPWGT